MNLPTSDGPFVIGARSNIVWAIQSLLAQYGFTSRSGAELLADGTVGPDGARVKERSSRC